MTSAQKSTWRAVELLLLETEFGFGTPMPLNSAKDSTVIFEIARGDVEMKFLIEPGGCLARIYT